MDNAFVKNYKMLKEKFPYTHQHILVDSKEEWASLMTLPKDMLLMHFRTRYSGRAYIVGGWPIVVAFYSDDDHMQAIMSL